MIYIHIYVCTITLECALSNLKVLSEFVTYHFTLRYIALNGMFTTLTFAFNLIIDQLFICFLLIKI